MQKPFFLVTAVGEGATGVALLIAPSVVLSLLLGVQPSHSETLVTGRITGAALVALGVSCWLARNDQSTPSQTGLLLGMLLYDAAVALLLVLSGLHWNLSGIGLWAAVALHSALGVWCLVCLATRSRKSAAIHH
jgi:hypothetical protein